MKEYQSIFWLEYSVNWMWIFCNYEHQCVNSVQKILFWILSNWMAHSWILLWIKTCVKSVKKPSFIFLLKSTKIKQLKLKNNNCMVWKVEMKLYFNVGLASWLAGLNPVTCTADFIRNISRICESIIFESKRTIFGRYKEEFMVWKLLTKS